jgi:cell shape-determining protein MreC
LHEFFVEITMLKEVGASGQISLGKKYAGQLFDMTVQPDGSIVMQPVKVVPVVQEQVATYQVWTQENAQRIEQYNAWAEQRQPYSQRVRQWREAK